MKQLDFRFLARAWTMSTPYWVSSEERWSARGLLAVILALNLSIVYLSVLFNEWNNAFYNSLQNLDGKMFWHELGIFCILATLHIVCAVYSSYLGQMIRIRWRRWMTTQFCRQWLGDKVYYRIQVKNGTDNPDQRISEDLGMFTDQTLGLSMGLLDTTVTLIAFVGILWDLSGALTVPWLHVTIPGYMVWLALLYATAGTWLAHKVGWPLTMLNYRQQQYEADFRYNLMRLRENAESIAFYGGEAREDAGLHERFANVYGNFWQLMLRQKKLGWFTSSYGQISIIVPFLIAAPRFFTRQITLGGLMQIASAFGSVQGCLSYFVSAYGALANWRAVTERLGNFIDQMEEPSTSAIVPERGGNGVTVADLDVFLPDGNALLNSVNFTVPRGGAVLISGPSGIGKSTLLRAVAGLWPYASGSVRLEDLPVLFVPQRPYLPLGTLRDAVCYPNSPLDVHRDRFETIFRDVRLEHLLPSLDVVDQWANRLSLGEQQRLAFARIQLLRPRLIFLDEATSALDEDIEAKLYGDLRAYVWKPAIISVGHRNTIRAFHDTVVSLTPPASCGSA